MTRLHDWQSVQKEVLRRINEREWKPGQQIPNEAELAIEFGCARSTVNRALREIAKTGLLDRKRRAGSKVAAQPSARATFTIPVIRNEIETRGDTYRHHVMGRKTIVPPKDVVAAMGLEAGHKMLFLTTLHLANGAPYVYERRWINPLTAPNVAQECFTDISANEWLLRHAAYTHGEISFLAANAQDIEAEALGCAPGTALFVAERITWNQQSAVTKVTLYYAEGYRLHTPL